MRIRPLLIVTAIISSALGAVVVYLVLTVPNDIQAGALMKQAHRDLAASRVDSAKDSLAKIVQQYPRTDAAAAATVALIKINDEDRVKLQHQFDSLRRDRDQQAAVLNQLQQTVAEMKAKPAVAPVVQAAKPTPAKKAPPHHRTRRTRRHRRR